MKIQSRKQFIEQIQSHKQSQKYFIEQSFRLRVEQTQDTDSEASNVFHCSVHYL